MKSIFKTLSIVIVVTGISVNIIAQEGEIFVSLAAGASIPLSEYAASDFNNPSSGFAKTGGNFGINFGYRFNEYLSLTGLLSGSVNRYDYIQLQNWLTENFIDLMPDTRWIVETKSWGLGGLLGGFTGSLPLVNNRFYVDARALGGFTYVYSPAIYITGIESGAEDIYLFVEQYSTGSWALDFGAGFRYKRTRNQYFTLYADYFMAHPKYSGVVSESNFGASRSDSFSQKINAVNISLGIGYIVN